MTKEKLQEILGDLFIDISLPAGSYTKQHYVDCINAFINLNKAVVIDNETYQHTNLLSFIRNKKYKVLFKYFYVPSIPRNWNNNCSYPSCGSVHMVIDSNGKKKIIYKRPYESFRDLDTNLDLNTLKSFYIIFVINAVTKPSLLRQIKEVRTSLLCNNSVFARTSAKTITRFDNVIFDIKEKKFSCMATEFKLGKTVSKERYPINYSGLYGMQGLAKTFERYKFIDKEDVVKQILQSREDAINNINEKYESLIETDFS